MKKRYIMPQVCVISGEFECHILAGSGPSKDSEAIIGGGEQGGNQEAGKTEGAGSGELEGGVGAKEHYNAWDAWED